MSTDIWYWQSIDKKHSDCYNAWKCPVPWHHGLLIYTHVDAPIHLLFLGVMKTVTN